MSVENIAQKLVEEPVTVYNFQVEEFHTYHVGNVSLLVHNAEYPKPPQYDKALYHNKGEKIKGAKLKSAAPKDGQSSLNKSIPVKPTTTRRISVEGDKFVVFDETSPGIFHGHIREWSQLTDAMKNALKNAGVVNKRGKIL